MIAVDADKCRAMASVKKELRVLLAEASCRNLSREEVHALVDDIYDEYED